MSWNHRVVRSAEGHLTIREIYYKDKDAGEDYDNIDGWTQDEIAPFEEEGENTLEGLIWTLDKMRLAADKPILDEAKLRERCSWNLG